MSQTHQATSLLERSEPLAVLARALAAARVAGQLVSLAGEAGIGKSSLLRAFAERHAGEARVLWGHCEALGTPRPLGPLLDIAAAAGGATAAAIATGRPRHELFAALIDDLADRAYPVVVVFEDVHWADEASFDLLQYVGRRIARTRAGVVITWRDDEVGADHPIHRVLGGLPHPDVHRIHLRGLSLEA